MSLLEHHSRSGVIVPENLVKGANGSAQVVGTVGQELGEVVVDSGGDWKSNDNVLGRRCA